ncbi:MULTISPECIES: hypothetical protein [unclassified Xanthobacter]|uniref:hypothetical protein n=1 Tax=unclassified Xanthobacter TaxID=2623496 RepID=UPI001EE0324C|nr:MULTISPECIES: hypothetical protein [unclassified Xanthobacter]
MAKALKSPTAARSAAKPSGAASTTQATDASAPTDATAPVAPIPAGDISNHTHGGEPPAERIAGPAAQPEPDMGAPASGGSEDAPARQGTPIHRPSETGEAEEEAAVASSSADLAAAARMARRAEMAARLGELAEIAARGEAPSLSILGGADQVLSWRLAEDALLIVSSAGRKYRIDRATGAVVDTATGEEML